MLKSSIILPSNAFWFIRARGTAWLRNSSAKNHKPVIIPFAGKPCSEATARNILDIYYHYTSPILFFHDETGRPLTSAEIDLETLEQNIKKAVAEKGDISFLGVKIIGVGYEEYPDYFQLGGKQISEIREALFLRKMVVIGLDGTSAPDNHNLLSQLQRSLGTRSLPLRRKTQSRLRTFFFRLRSEPSF
jgi:hypothetical protein